jgi:hypothetical protein
VTPRKVIGGSILAVIGIGLFAYVAADVGVLSAIAIIAASIAFAVAIVVAINLMAE